MHTTTNNIKSLKCPQVSSTYICEKVTHICKMLWLLIGDLHRVLRTLESHLVEYDVKAYFLLETLSSGVVFGRK